MYIYVLCCPLKSVALRGAQNFADMSAKIYVFFYWRLSYWQTDLAVTHLDSRTNSFAYIYSQHMSTYAHICEYIFKYFSRKYAYFLFLKLLRIYFNLYISHLKSCWPDFSYIFGISILKEIYCSTWNEAMFELEYSNWNAGMDLINLKWQMK